MHGSDEMDDLEAGLSTPVPDPDWRRVEARLRSAAEARSAGIRRGKALRWALPAAAAAGLLAAFGLRGRGPSVPALPLPAAAVRDPGLVYLTPDAWARPEAGSRCSSAGDVLRLASGGILLECRGTSVSVETPAGRVRTSPACLLRVEVEPVPSRAAWFREAFAAESSVLTVEVRRGTAVLERPGESPLEVKMGRRLRIGPSGPEWGEVAPEPLEAGPPRRWDPPLRIEGAPGFLALEAPASAAYVWELKVRAPRTGTSLALAFPAGGGLRLWHLEGALPAGVPVDLRISVRGAWMEGWIGSRRVFSTLDGRRSLQDPSVPAPGPVAWGAVEVFESRQEILP